MDLDEEAQKLGLRVRHMRLLKDPQIFEKVENLEKKCREKARDDSDVYITCMLELQEKIDYQEAILAYKSEFIMKKAVDCFNRKKESIGNIEFCKNEAISFVKKFISQYNDSI